VGTGLDFTPVISLVYALLAAVLLQAGFAPWYQGWLVVPALMLFFEATKRARSAKAATLSGFVFGLVFVGGLMVWLQAVPGPAWIALTPITAAGFGVVGWTSHRSLALSSFGRFSGLVLSWLGWLLILRFAPIVATEWPDPGYTVVQWQLARNAASVIGMTGWSTVLALAAAAFISAVWDRSARWFAAGVVILGVAFGLGAIVNLGATGELLNVAVVQGNSPCDFGVHCPNEREIITQNHLDLTSQLSGPLDLVVWAESATGFTTDPARSPTVASEIAAQAQRLDAHLLIGSDRPVGDHYFTNSNILFSPTGEIVGEYEKQHGVPFGEYVPYRSFFERWPSIVQISRDMIPGEGPVLLEIDDALIGSVISYEAAFGRYARLHAKQGAQLLVVATNEASYGKGAAADQLIAMSTMRGAENGLDVIHSAITGSSVIISNGTPVTEVTDLFSAATIEAAVHLRDQGPTPYAQFGDWLVALTLLVLGSVLVMEVVETWSEKL
jgi:apolipoprotein N-acyltransferase